MARVKGRQKSSKKAIPPKVKTIGGIAIPTNLPVPTKGRDLSKANKIKIAGYICQLYATDQFTLEDVLVMFGIKSYNTFKKWKNEIAEIAILYKESISEKESRYLHSLKERARTSLEKKVDGHVVVLKTTKTRRPTQSEKRDQPQITMMLEETEKEVYIPPSDTAIIYVLNNQDGENFTRNPLPVAPDEKDVNIPPINWVD